MARRSKQQRSDNKKLYVDVSWPGVKRIRRTSPIQTSKGRDEYTQQIRQQLLLGTWGQKPTPMLKEFIAEYTEKHINSAKRSEVTAYNDKLRLAKHWVPWLKEYNITQLKEIDAHALETYVEDKFTNGGLAASTVNQHLNLIRSMLNKAVLWKYLKKADLPKVPMIRAKREKDVRFLTEEEVQLGLTAFAGPVQLKFLLGTFCGLRHGELLALTWGDIDFTQKVVNVRRRVWNGQVGPTKGGKPRSVHMPEVLIAALKPHRALPNVWLFPGPKGLPQSQGTSEKHFKKVCKRLGWDDVTMHTLRHTFCSQLARAGVPAMTIQKLAGHHSLTVTMMYMHLAEGDTAKAVDHLAVTLLCQKDVHQGALLQTNPDSHGIVDPAKIA